MTTEEQLESAYELELDILDDINHLCSVLTKATHKREILRARLKSEQASSQVPSAVDSVDTSTLT